MPSNGYHDKIRKILAMLEGAKTEGEAKAANLALQRLLVGRQKKENPMATKFKTFTDDEIRRKNEFCNVPVLTEGGECFIVKAVHMYLDEEHAEVDSVTDIAVFATEGEAADFAAKLTKVADDGCFAEKHMYTVSCRHLDR